MSKTLTTSTVTQRDRKGRRFMEKVGAAYDKAGFDDDRAQRLNESPLFIKELGLLMAKHTQSDSRFRFVTAFDIVVPEDYDHATRLDMFRDRHSREFDNYNPAITDANYAAKATIKLAPGRRLKCRVFWINEAVSSDDCLGFLRNQKAILTGAQGASLAYEQGKDRLPKSRYYVSFDDRTLFGKIPTVTTCCRACTHIRTALSTFSLVCLKPNRSMFAVCSASVTRNRVFRFLSLKPSLTSVGGGFF